MILQFSHDYTRIRAIIKFYKYNLVLLKEPRIANKRAKTIQPETFKFANKIKMGNNCQNDKWAFYVNLLQLYNV